MKLIGLTIIASSWQRRADGWKTLAQKPNFKASYIMILVGSKDWLDQGDS